MEAIDELVERIGSQLDLDAEREHEVLEEIHSHLAEAAAEARRRGVDEAEAVAEVAARFGVEQVASELQQVHEGWGALEGIAAAALPVLFALALRWLTFAPDGTYVGWRQALERPAFWTVAVMALLIPLWRFPRRRYAVISWAVFWGLSVLIIVGNAVSW